VYPAQGLRWRPSAGQTAWIELLGRGRGGSPDILVRAARDETCGTGGDECGHMHRFACLAFLVLSGSVAAAEPHVSLTVSPVHLVIPMAEVTAELRATSKLAASVIAGAGAFRDEDTNTKITLVEVGVSPRYYLLGTFRHGLELGAELLYLHAGADDLTGSNVRAAGLSVGPYVGYKWIARVGFTLEAQVGASFLAVRGDSETMSTSDSRVGPLLNLQTGWSF